MYCDICNSTDLEQIFEKNLNYTALKNLSNINITSCKTCGFCFNSKISQEDCNEYYETIINYTHNLYLNHNNELQHDRYSHLDDLLKKHNIQKNSSIIDITSSDGSLIYYLQYLGYNNLTLCDISVENIEKEYLNVKKHKLNIMKKSDYNYIKNKYDFIFFNHTLEHIRDFNVFYENIKILMHYDSLLYIEVPDINRISSTSNFFLEITHEHINFFNINLLNNLSLKYGFINTSSGILDFNYRKVLEIKATYGVYKIDKFINKKIKHVYDSTITQKLVLYIRNSLEHSNKIYEKLDKNLNYSIYGIGLYVLYFLSIHDINISNLYDRIKTGSVKNIEIKNISESTQNELFLILNEERYYDLLDDLKRHIPNPNIYKL